MIEDGAIQDDAAALRGFVAERDVGCPSCDYNLRGLTGDVCPECGVGLRLRVGLAEPRVLGYVLVMVGAALGVGAAGFLFSIALVELGMDRFFGRYTAAAWTTVGMLVGGVGLLVVLIRLRGWFYRRGLGFRVGMVVAVWAAAVAGIGYLVAAID